MQKPTDPFFLFLKTNLLSIVLVKVIYNPIYICVSCLCTQKKPKSCAKRVQMKINKW